MFVFCNPNPEKSLVGDWQTTYLGVTVKGFGLYDMPSSNNVWGAYLEEKGFERLSIPNTCPNCYTIKDFCKDNPKGIYIIGTGSHAVAIIDGNSTRGSYNGNSMRGGSYEGNMMSNDMGNSQRYLPPYPMYSYAPVWNNPQQQPNNNQNQNNEMNGNSQNYNGNVSNANNGMSNDGRRGRDADSDGRYSEESSYRRGRDAMGRFTSRDGYDNSNRYSRHSVKDRMIAKLEDMADDATTSRERNTIMQCIDKLDN